MLFHDLKDLIPQGHFNLWLHKLPFIWNILFRDVKMYIIKLAVENQTPHSTHKRDLTSGKFCDLAKRLQLQNFQPSR